MIWIVFVSMRAHAMCFDPVSHARSSPILPPRPQICSASMSASLTVRGRGPKPPTAALDELVADGDLKPAAVLKPVADSKPPALLKRQQNLLSFFTVPAKKAATKSTAKKAHANFTIDSDSDVEVVDVVPARNSSSRTAVKPKTYVLDDSDDSDVKVVDVVPARKRSAGTAGSDDDSDFEFY
ncbi:hypothetical protein ACHAWO_008832 [Cyclotella atomus]|uniref:Uncharacterized protein n=1 Tax=Cyclotella atomus TaxID=382360 RepID=A0ABD3P7Q5_9STRA